jgi:hypothetical protein
VGIIHMLTKTCRLAAPLLSRFLCGKR